MDLYLQGQVALVTGAAAGIGAAIARELVVRGASLAAVDVNDIDIDDLRARAVGDAKVQAWRADVRESRAVNDTCQAARETLGPVTILVNNVGGAGEGRCTGIEDVTDDLWDLVLALNLGSIMRFSRALVPGMKQQNHGRIINIGSSLMHGYFGKVGTSTALLPYVTAKSGLAGLTKQLAYELASFGITVNAVVPGLTLPGPDAKITRRFQALPIEEQRALAATVPAGRLGTGEDIANAVSFIASPAAAYIAGELISVTGGS